MRSVARSVARRMPMRLAVLLPRRKCCCCTFSNSGGSAEALGGSRYVLDPPAGLGFRHAAGSSGRCGAGTSSPPRLVMACAPCHGFDGIGHDRTIPNLAGQHRDYLSGQLTAFRSGQRIHPTMNFFSGQMTRGSSDKSSNISRRCRGHEAQMGSVRDS